MLRYATFVVSFMANVIEVCDFTKRRFGENCHWTDGNCLWFAYILKSRFDDVDIVYDYVAGHFLVSVNGTLVDWTGIVEPIETIILLDEIHDTDPLWYKHLMRDCWM